MHGNLIWSREAVFESSVGRPVPLHCRWDGCALIYASKVGRNSGNYQDSDQLSSIGVR